MPAVLPVSEAKRHFTIIHRQASEGGRVFMVADGRRKDAKVSVTLGAEALQAVIADVKFTPEWIEDTENGGWTVVIKELDIFGEGDTRDEAIADVVKTAAEYAQLYSEDAALYFRMGRRNQYRYVLRILLAVAQGENLRTVLGL